MEHPGSHMDEHGLSSAPMYAYITFHHDKASCAHSKGTPFFLSEKVFNAFKLVCLVGRVFVCLFVCLLVCLFVWCDGGGGAGDGGGGVWCCVVLLVLLLVLVVVVMVLVFLLVLVPPLRKVTLPHV